MNSIIYKILHHLSSLLRTRVIISFVGLWAASKTPEIAPFVLGICGLALGVSAIDAYRRKDGKPE